MHCRKRISKDTLIHNPILPGLNRGLLGPEPPIITHFDLERNISLTQLTMSIDFPKEEHKILALWETLNAFQRQVELSEGKPPFTFYDGPPFATGLPHYGHLLTSTIKDIIPRYWSMKGHYVERRFGWDTHGVPIEYEIDKKLGMSGKVAVEKIGIKEYNAQCRAIVMRFASEWRQTITRLGRWIDFDNDYKVRWRWIQEKVVLTDTHADYGRDVYGNCLVGL